MATFCYSSSNGRSRNFPKITRLEFSSPFSWCTKELLLPKEVILEWKELVFFLDLMFILLIKGFEHIPVRQFLWFKLCIASWKVHYALKLFATGFLCLFFLAAAHYFSTAHNSCPKVLAPDSYFKPWLGNCGNAIIVTGAGLFQGSTFSKKKLVWGRKK